MNKIFILEDEENIRELVCYAISSQGFECKGFERAKGFVEAVAAQAPSVIILDIMLPDEDGLSVLGRLRRDSFAKDIPIIMLTAKSSEYDKVKGLDTGADDYMTKPFSILELISRINAILRRTGKAGSNADIESAGIVLDNERRTVKADDCSISLTLKEFELLKLLMENEGKVVTRERITENVWGWDFEGESRTVDMHIKTLRQKLKSKGSLIETVRGIGYRFGGEN